MAPLAAFASGDDPLFQETAHMVHRSLVVLALASLGLIVGCAGVNEESKKERDPWSDFKGTYSTPGAPREKEAKADAPAKKDAKAKADQPKEETPAAAAEDGSEGLPPAPINNAAKEPEKKKASKGAIKGESVSSISVDALTDASKSSMPKAKFVSNGVVTGDKYEMVSVQLKGASIQIIRPAEKPAPTGPAIASPKAKSGELAKSDASYYDADADVLVVVSAGKKAAAQKTLNSLVKR
jgi:hypothetical protein